MVLATGQLYLRQWPETDLYPVEEDYLSCAYRALCLASFLSEWSLETVQVLILICNYFVTNSRTTDCWTFSGILHKVVYGLDLHHAPSESTSLSTRHLRYSLWQAFMFQDVSLSYFLELVPASCHHTIDVKAWEPIDEGANNSYTRLREMLSPQGPGFDIGFLSNKTDMAYQRAMWQFSEFMQTNICIPTALGQEIIKNAAHKKLLLSELQTIHDRLDAPFANTSDLRGRSGRVFRQMVMVTSNYQFAFGMLFLAHNTAQEVGVDWRGALRSSNRAMAAFFGLVNQHRQHLTMWTPSNTRAYAQTVCIPSPTPNRSSTAADSESRL